MKQQIVIGLMSGTSVDSVDAAALVVTGSGALDAISLEILGGISHPIPIDLKALIFELFEDGEGSLKKQCLANMRIGHLFADAVEVLLKTLNLKAADVALIGSHGQTIYHVADFEECCGMELRGSLQIGEGSVIAQRTGIPVVSDFRVGDIAAGGGGAPLVPFLDKLLIKKHEPGTVFQNIGGIGNLSWFPEDGGEPVAFDTGPGNMIMDHIVSEYTAGKMTYDQDGRIGREGRVLTEVLEQWMTHPYLAKLPPKSTGREEFGGEFFRTYLAGLVAGPDLIRTAAEYTVRTIAESCRNFLTEPPSALVVAGGGAFNPLIMEGLQKALPETRILTGDETGMSSEFKEAAAFALMAWCFDNGLPNNLEAATGAERPVVMGKLSQS